jgi:hypothetical protein
MRNPAVLAERTQFPSVLAGTWGSRILARDPQRRQAAAERLKAYGITEDQIHAKALGKAGKDMDLLDRLITNRGITRRALLKEHERLQKRAAKTKRLQAATKPPPEQTEPVKAKANPFPSPVFPPGYQ